MNFKKICLIFSALFLFSTPALAGTVTLGGSIDGTEPTFDQPVSSATTLTSYDTFSFSVDTDGMYSILSFYPGDTELDENLDGVLLLYSGAFDPLAPAGFLASDDDYAAGDVPALAGSDGACVGQNCSGFEAALTAGTTYILVQTSFTDVPNSFGQPAGDYESIITGPGEITVDGVVPVPAAGWLLFSAIAAGLGMSRRK